MRLLSLFLCVSLIFILPSKIAAANTISNYLQKIDGQIITKKMSMADRTFTQFNNISQFYFAKDRRFIFQLNENEFEREAGTEISGTWSVQNDSLCLKYDEKSLEKVGFEKAVECYDIYIEKNLPSEAFLRDSSAAVTFFNIKNENKGFSSLSFHSWNYGNFLLDTQYVKNIKNQHMNLRTIVRQYRAKLPEGTVDRSLLNANMQEYYDLIVGKVFTIDNKFYSYFLPTGQYYWISEDDIIKARGDINSLISLTKKGTWSMKGNIHCWESGQHGGSCEFIFPQQVGLQNGKTLGFLSLHNSGAFRQHTHNQSFARHLEPHETPYPALFAHIKDSLK